MAGTLSALSLRRRPGMPAGPRSAGALAAAVLVAVSVLGFGMIATPGVAAPAIMPAHAIAVGMTGVGKTVIIGTSVVPFNVRVLGILHNAGPAGDLVLFRASGPAIQSVGGIAAGMSGSPIYLEGKLAGALSYTFQASDPTVGLFTPIEDMLRVLPGPAQSSAPRVYALAPTRLAGRIVRRVVVPAAGGAGGTAAAARGARPSARDTLVAVPAETPLFVSGIGGAGLQAL